MGTGNFANFANLGRVKTFSGLREMRAGANGGFTSGEIIAKDDKSITIKLQDGGSKIIFLTSNTPVTKNISGSLVDLKVGSAVTVSGTPNQDGSVSAQSVQIK